MDPQKIAPQTPIITATPLLKSTLRNWHYMVYPPGMGEFQILEVGFALFLDKKNISS